MSRVSPTPKGRRSGADAAPLPARTKLRLALLLGVPIVVPLLIPLYDRQTPDLGGIPFFFWAQFAMIPFASALTWAAYSVVTRHERGAAK